MFDKAKQETQTAPILRYLLRQSGYMYLGLLSLTGLTLVDLWFVSQLGESALQILSFSTPVTMGAVSLLLALGTSITALASNLAGSGSDARNHAFHINSMWLSTGLGIILCLTGFIFHDIIFSLLGLGYADIQYGKEYMYPLYLALIPASLGSGILAIFRAQGDQRLPGFLFFGAMLINIVLDPLLIFGVANIPAFGLAGAAYATLIALSIMCLISYILFLRAGNGGFSLTVTWFHDWVRSWQLFWPAAISRLSLPFISALLIGFMARIDEQAVTAYGIAYRFDLVIMMYPIALSNALAPFVGQHRGANVLNRMNQGIAHALWILIIYAIIASTAFLLGGPFLAELFTESDAIAGYFTLYYQIVPWGWFFQFLMMLSAGLLYVFDRPRQALLLVMAQVIIVYLPIWSISYLQESIALFFISFPIAYLIAGILGWLLLRKLQKLK